MKEINFLFILIVFFAMASCKTNKNGATNKHNNNISATNTPVVNYINLSDGNIKYSEHTDAFNIKEVSRTDSIITINLEYTGGCQQHEIDVTWNGSMRKSLPPQVDFKLFHKAHNDSCQNSLNPIIKLDASQLLGTQNATEYVIFIVNASNNQRLKAE